MPPALPAPLPPAPARCPLLPSYPQAGLTVPSAPRMGSCRMCIRRGCGWTPTDAARPCSSTAHAWWSCPSAGRAWPRSTRGSWGRGEYRDRGGGACPTGALSFLRPLKPVAPRQRSSFLPSYIIDVRGLDEKLLNIVDLQFLHGYYEPTLLILFEPNQTWPG